MGPPTCVVEGEMQRVATLIGHDERVWHCDWRENGTSCSEAQAPQSSTSYVLATCGADKTIRLWDVPSMSRGPGRERSAGPILVSPIDTLEGSHTGTVRHVCFSPDGSLLASASFDKTVVVWGVCGTHRGAGHPDKLGDEFDENEELESIALTVLEGHESEVKSVAWNPSGGMLATCGRDKTVWFWEQSAGGGRHELDFEVIDVKHGHSQDIKSIAWHPSGELLVSVSYDNSLKLWKESKDTDEWECVKTVEGAHDSTVWDVRFERDGAYMVTCGDDCCVKVWQIGVEGESSGYGSASVACRCVATVSGYHDRPIYSVDAVWSSYKGEKRLLVVSGGGDDAIVVMEVDVESIAGGVNVDGGVIQMKAIVRGAHAQDVNCVRWRPGYKDGMDEGVYVLASCGDDGEVAIWELRA